MRCFARRSWPPIPGVIDTPLLERAAQLEYEAMGKIATSYHQL